MKAIQSPDSKSWKFQLALESGAKGYCPDCQFSHYGKCGELIDCIGCGEQKQSFNDNVRLCKPCRDRLVRGENRCTT